MPQFDFANFVPQMAWLAILFAVLYFVIVRATLPKLDKVIGQREGTISGDINAAESAKAEADAVSSAYAVSLRKAQDEARAHLAGARGEAQRAIEAELAEVDQSIGGRLQAAQSALDAATSKAMVEIETVAGEAAGDIVERLTGVKPAAEAASAAAKTALAQA
jgi:F-type H+-transporting ATPase subunit b